MTKSPYYSRDNRPKSLYNATGDGYEKEYGVSLEENGHKVLGQTGKRNAYAIIQTYAEECKIENILQRSILDPSILAVKQAMYDDFTDAPKTMYDAQNMMIEMENIWGSLSAEERAEYDNELSQFITAVGSEKWLKTMGVLKETTPEEPTPTPTPTPTEEKGGEK